jgi:hypothetical protein
MKSEDHASKLDKGKNFDFSANFHHHLEIFIFMFCVLF